MTRSLATSVLAAGMLIGATEGSADEATGQTNGRRLEDRLSTHMSSVLSEDFLI